MTAKERKQAAQAEKARQRAEDKARKEQEKQDKRDAKLREQQAKGRNACSEITVFLDRGLRCTKLGGAMEAAIQEPESKLPEADEEESKVPDVWTIRWRRRVTVPVRSPTTTRCDHRSRLSGAKPHSNHGVRSIK